MRRWDATNSLGVDEFATLSHFIADRIERAYGRSAEVIYPPVDTDFFTPSGARADPALHAPRSRLDVMAAGCVSVMGVPL